MDCPAIDRGMRVATGAPIGGIARILSVDNLGHPSQRPQHLLLVDYAVLQPVGDVLA